MKNPAYFRLVKDGRFAGFKRVVTEYLPAGSSVWQLRKVDHNSEETISLRGPATGIENLKREKISVTDDASGEETHEDRDN